ncbi:hypothetical protein BJG93_34640 (plasmid) [Paraburkholderia sprentiae WSM5005]|uniref:Uncharacterized protein n=1 Tax=Paraburkholderia sprentiae WSM5005 TaxID=754502 RepID=A0ACA8AX17_9BURK|nr:hypothetical protein [Paraburkholderia sprentiae]APA90253.2 hypothetical protein BJG93_34640 [Paraburkholderia sprentiae WSM5005]
MASTRRSIEKNEIEVARQKLLEAIYSELPDDRFLGRDAVKQLLSTLIAARERGLPFERISDILKQAGLDLAPVTLRRYFFELKTDAELAAENARHAKKVADTRRAIQDKVLELHTEHGNALAAKRARLTQATPRFANAFGSESTTPDVPTITPAAVHSAGTKSVISERENARPASPAAPVPPPAASEPARLESEGAVPGPILDVKSSSTLPTSEKANRAAPDIQSDGAMTLADIERASLATEERTELMGDVELRAGELVYYVSGQPFHGLLSQRQIRLLRTVGRIIAPTKGKSSKDFVSMPTKL